jgi:crotonobetainyl-CoA:carnitine CoA-transferase CaiB-like acyl-CoA transferase
MATGPLDGIRVLEFTQIIAGPFGCQNLSDMGAEVIKVEPPEGEPWRIAQPFIPLESKWFQSLNRGKKSLVLKLQDERAQKVVHDLVPSVDVVVINYRPDVPARLGIDYETLSAIKPDLIYVDNTAFGRNGPWAHRPGYDIVVQAVTGLMAGEGKVNDGGAPEQMTSSAISDYATGIAIAWATCAALFHRERTGEGQLVEASLLATALSLQGSFVMELPVADEAARVPMMENINKLRAEGASYPDLIAAHDPFAAMRAMNIYYRAFKTKDGALAIGALSRGLREKVRAALELDVPDHEDVDITDPAVLGQFVALGPQVEELLQSKTNEEWMAIFDREGVPAGPVSFAEDMAHDPQVVDNEFVVDLEHDLAGPQRQVAPIVKFSKSPLAAQGSSPPLGRDTDDLVRGASYSDDQIAELREAGIIA